MKINQEKIEAAIIAEVSQEMMGAEELLSKIKVEVDKRISKLFAERADAQIQSAIDDAVKDGFEREYQRVTPWGEKEGAPTTIRKELGKLIGDYWNTNVGKDGKPSSYNNVTRAEFVMSKLVAEDFNNEMKQHIVNVGGALKDQLRASLHETINELVSGVFKVNSLGDQAIQKGGSRRTGGSMIDPEQKA